MLFVDPVYREASETVPAEVRDHKLGSFRLQEEGKLQVSWESFQMQEEEVPAATGRVQFGDICRCFSSLKD